MMPCKKIQELLKAEYLDKEMGQKEEQFIKAHLAQCSACSALERKMQAQRMLFQGVKPKQVPERIWSNISEAIVAERLKQEEGATAGMLGWLRGKLFLPKPAVVLATSFFSAVIIFAVFVNISIQRQVSVSKQNAAESIAGYSLDGKNGSALYDLGTSIEEYFL